MIGDKSLIRIVIRSVTRAKPLTYRRMIHCCHGNIIISKLELGLSPNRKNIIVIKSLINLIDLFCMGFNSMKTHVRMNTHESLKPKT